MEKEQVEKSEVNISEDIKKINQIPIIPTLLEVICQTTGMGFAAIARVTEDKWVACSVRDDINFGLQPGGELQLETTICHEIRQSGNAVIIDHVEKDEHFFGHHTPLQYGFQSYISIPIILKNGNFFGTLCAIDPKPAQLNNSKIIGMFRLFADLISFHLNAIDQLGFVENKLMEEQKTAELREQFIAILGHDLRNPLTAISNGAQLMMRMPLEKDVMLLAGMINNSSYRMSGLIKNILDFAHGRLGGGIVLNRKANEAIEKIVMHVVTESRMIWPGRKIDVDFQLFSQVNADGERIAQLLSNLLGNALIYGKASEPVQIQAISGDGEFKLSVTNSGDKIPDDVLQRIFKPFSRGQLKASQEGLGLGLFIAHEIAQAHGGLLEVSSTSQQTCFVLKIPQIKK